MTDVQTGCPGKSGVDLDQCWGGNGWPEFWYMTAVLSRIMGWVNRNTEERNNWKITCRVKQLGAH